MLEGHAICFMLRRASLIFYHQFYRQQLILKRVKSGAEQKTFAKTGAKPR